MPLQGTTTYGVPNRLPVTEGLVALLATGTGRPVGVTRAPYKGTDVEHVADPPYAIVYPLPGGAVTGSYFSHPDEEVTWVYEVTSVGIRDDQAQWMADVARQSILGRDASG